MAHDLDVPPSGQSGADWASLYRTRGNEVVHHRPVFTGDVFERVEVQGLGSTKKKSIMVLQHPCALRTNGVDLTDRLLIAEVRTHPLIVIKAWSGHLSKMPLPDLVPTVDSGKRHQAAFFDQPYFVAPENLYLAKRIACLSQVGVNLLLQRWVHYNSRATVPTSTYQEVSSPAYEEADLIEEWCDECATDEDFDIPKATADAVKWLREDAGAGLSRQRLLEDPQSRSTVRRDMRAELRRQHEN